MMIMIQRGYQSRLHIWQDQGFWSIIRTDQHFLGVVSGNLVGDTSKRQAEDQVF